MNTLSPSDRLARLRSELVRRGLDAFIVRGTDRYLNEYVPEAESTRVWLTGFTGSTGDALVARDRAWLIVDGRYHLQADREVDPALWQVVKSPLGVSNEVACTALLRELVRGGPMRVGYEPDRFGLQTLAAFVARFEGAPIEMVPTLPSLVEVSRGPVAPSPGRLRAIDESAVGRTVADKIALIARWLQDNRLDALVVSRLDEIAWVTNLRGDELPYQATFRALAAVTATEVLLAVDASEVTEAIRAARPGVRFVTRDALMGALAAGGAPTVALDPSGSSVALDQALKSAGATVREVTSPIVQAKAIKTPAELAAMGRAFARADGVVADAQTWLQERIGRGERVTEADFARAVERLFRAAGATGLSFRVISAAGINGADVHHPPSDEDLVREGEMMLLDTGCYFEEGYATDLTRTFFVGGEGVRPSDAQRRIFTLTLKAAIAGMSARIPRGATGAQLDGITRRPLWAHGVDYAHGTGHGVGINVHEAPPRIANTAVTPIEVGQVFSIEPGIYQQGVGGVRIENLCTVVPDPAHEGFLCVEALTFSPLDERLIDPALLDAAEKAFLDGYRARWRPKNP